MAAGAGDLSCPGELGTWEPLRPAKESRGTGVDPPAVAGVHHQKSHEIGYDRHLEDRNCMVNGAGRFPTERHPMRNAPCVQVECCCGCYRP